MKKSILYIAILTFCLSFMLSCEAQPSPISYGEDKCSFCSMNIMDKPYGTELVTHKGKVFKFDSTECMLDYLGENEEDSFSLFLTNTMDRPGELVAAKSCVYLISENLPSPMGANITAFTTMTKAKEAQQEYDGEIYSWDSLKEKRGNKPKRHHSH